MSPPPSSPRTAQAPPSSASSVSSTPSPASPSRPSPPAKAVVPGAPGHGCGHNLLGSGAALAAVAVKEYMAQKHLTGTLRFYGTPAEEGGAGKVYMIRAGLFKDVDVVLHWHPGDRNAVSNGGLLAVIDARFTFHGVAAHAAFAPDRGRSALDAVMLMGNGIEFMREHIPSNTRIHYVITKGGVAANVVPDLAQMDLMARNPSNDTLAGIWDRIHKVAEGAALMTGTTMDMQIVSTDANIIPNDVLAPVAQKNLESVGGYTMDAAQREFALNLQKSLPPGAAGSLGLRPRRSSPSAPSTPTPPPPPPTSATSVGTSPPSASPPPPSFPARSRTVGRPPQSAGTSIGQDGMVIASKAIALTAVDLFESPTLVTQAKAEFHHQTEGKTYFSAIPMGQKAFITYRDNN